MAQVVLQGGQPAETWADYTSANVNNSNAVVLDTQVVSALRIQQPLLDGNAMISGQFNQGSATDFANVLRYGSLPLSFDISEAQTVSATLGYASLQAGLIAGLVGLALVFVYSLFYYRALGVLTILSLIAMGQAAGFTLSEISGMIRPDGRPHIPRADLHAKADALQRQITDLRVLRDVLRHVADCSAPSHLECPTFRKLMKGALSRQITSRRSRHQASEG